MASQVPPKPPFFSLAEDFDYWIRGPSYEKMYPYINQRNVFSVSTLAYKVEKQVDWKLSGKKENGKINGVMFGGKAKHEFLLKRWQANTDHPEMRNLEQTLEFHIPYVWKNHPFNEIVLLGHVDGVDWLDGYFIELKTTDWGGPNITPYMILQAGAYGFMLHETFDRFYQPVIVKTNSEVTVKPLGWLDCIEQMDEMVRRAKETARLVDV